jgi:CHAD domain-containing protein
MIWDAFGAVLAYDIDPRTADPAAIHQVRIAAKKLRYTLEAFEDALEPGATLIDDVRALQDSAGSMHDAIVAGDRARSTVRPRDLKRREQRAIDTFADAQAREAERPRPSIARALRTVRSRAFRESLGRAVAGMGHVGS